MTGEKSVLVIGLEPTLIDFSQPGYAPGMDATKVFAGLKSSEDELTRLGYRVHMCLTDFGETAEAVVHSALTQKRFECILIGAGIRTNPSNFLLFEKLITQKRHLVGLKREIRLLCGLLSAASSHYAPLAS